MTNWEDLKISSELLIRHYRRRALPIITLSGKNMDGIKLILDEFMAQGASFTSLRDAAKGRVRGDHFVGLVRSSVGIFLNGVAGDKCLSCYDMRPTGEWVEACATLRHVCVMAAYGDKDSTRDAIDNDFSSVLSLNMAVRFG